MRGVRIEDAMAWIEVHQSLPTHRKTLTVADLLDVPPVHVVGHLVAFWLWAVDNAPDGQLNGISARMIARAAQWDGDPDRFAAALVTAGYLDVSDNGYVIHDWDDYAGRLIERRIAERERSRQRRAASRELNGQRTSVGRPMVDRQTTVGTLPNLTIPNQTKRLNIHAKLNTHAKLSTHAPDGAIAQLQPGEQRKRAKTPGASPESVEAQRVTAAGEDKPRPPFRSKRQQEMFDNFFWPAYPKKRSKGQAERAWVKLNPSEELFREIMAGVERAKASEEWQRENGRFIPYPATWLNAKGWEDEYTPAPPREGVGPGAKGGQHSGAATKDQELDLDKFCWPGTRV